MRDAESLARVKAATRRNLEIYISACYELAAGTRDAEEASFWRSEGAFAETAKARLLARLEQMILYASGEYAPEIAGQARPGPGAGVTINAQGDAILTNVASNRGTITGKNISGK